jgi:hypothetical protein
MKEALAKVEFEQSVVSLIGLTVSHIWQGYGSAIFLEIGDLAQGRKRRDGSLGNPVGAFTFSFEWSWRIEGKRTIWCGSNSDRETWPNALVRLQGALVESVSLYGRLPEIDLGFSNGLHLSSMTTVKGDPDWGLIDRARLMCFAVRAGRIAIDRR